jgi:ketosteroid isomerase-like protein
MPRSEVETVRRIYELARDAWDQGRKGAPGRLVELTRELWDPDLVIEEMSTFPDTDTYRGYEGLARWWTAFFDVYDVVRLEPQEFIPHGDRVVVQVRLVLRSKMGVELEQDGTHVWTLRNGRAVHVTGYGDRAEALRAAGIPDGAERA